MCTRLAHSPFSISRFYFILNAPEFDAENCVEDKPDRKIDLKHNMEVNNKFIGQREKNLNSGFDEKEEKQCHQILISEFIFVVCVLHSFTL